MMLKSYISKPKSNMTYISHDLGVGSYICEREADGVADRYKHLDSLPQDECLNTI